MATKKENQGHSLSSWKKQIKIPKMKKLKLTTNTKGFCFLCLEVITAAEAKAVIKTDDKKTNNSDKSKGKSPQPPVSVSLRCLRRHLRINLAQLILISSSSSSSSSSLNKEGKEAADEVDVAVNLCQSCDNLLGKFSDKFQQLEKIQMEVDFYLEGIRKRILESSRNLGIVKKYSKCMMRDPDALKQLPFLNKLRREIAQKSDVIKNAPHLRIHLTRDAQNTHSSSPQHSQINSIDNVKEEPLSDNEELSPSNPTPPASASASSSSVSQPPKNTSSSVSVIKMYSKNPETGRFDCSKSKCSESFSFANCARRHYKNTHLPKKKAVPKLVEYGPIFKMYLKNPETGTFACTSCDKVFKQNSGAISHYKTIHLKIPSTYLCDNCGKSFQRPANLKIHKELCSAKTQNFILNEETGKYKCIKCPQDFATVQYGWQHFQKVHMNRKFTCGVCKFATYSCPRTMRKHEKICRTLTVKKQRKTVKYKLDPEKYKFSCPKSCGRRFQWLSNMDSHVHAVHLQERNFSCEIDNCRKRFGTNSQLQEHKNGKHNLEEQYPCKVCNRKFRWKQQRGKHEKLCEEKKEKESSSSTSM